MKIQISTFISLIFLLISPFLCIQGQVQINAYTLSVIDDIPEEKEDQIVETASEILRKYGQVAGLIDQEYNEVTQRSIQRFKELFGSNAQIVNDLAENYVLNNYNDYASDVLEYLLTDGVEFDLPFFALMELRYDEAGYYILEAKAEKTVYNGLGIDNRPLPRCKTGRLYLLDFTISIPENALDRGEITRISGLIQRYCEDATPFVSAGFRYGALDVGSEFIHSSFLTNSMTGLDFEHEEISSLSGGLSFQLPITKRELIFLSVGANFGIYDIAGSIKGQYTIQDDKISGATVSANGVSGDYVGKKIVNISGGLEEVSVQVLEVPIGLRFRKGFRNNKSLTIIGDVLFVPTLHLSSKSMLGVDRVRYSGVFDTNGTEGDELEVGFPKDEDTVDSSLEFLGFGERSKLKNNPELAEATSFFIRVAPGVQYQIAEKLWLEVLVDYSMGLTSFLNHDNITNDEYFLSDKADRLQNLDAELENSFLERYTESDKISTLGIRIGVLLAL